MGATRGRPDAFEQMRLPDAGRPVEHQRRVLAGLLNDHLGRRDGQSIAGAHDKRVEIGESTAMGQGGRFSRFRRRRTAIGQRRTRRWARLLLRFLLRAGLHRVAVALAGRSFELELNRRASAQHVVARRLDVAAEVRANPL